MAKINNDDDLTQDERWRAFAQAAQDGDKQSYSKLLSQIAPYIRATISHSLANPEWADDITQEVLISVHKSLNTYSPKRPFKPWLRALINFRRADYLRKYYSKKGNEQTSLDNPEFIKKYVTEPSLADEYIDVDRALKEFTDEQRNIFTKVKIEGHAIKDVAEELDMSESAVKVSAHRTLQKLRGLLR
ncbi:MAG: hypothetical protein CMH26_07395 [Micavibrio sp.]|nr:hypothetical protein [Micavibrio sp.]|tara:strand:- start:2092 stop:2655 length:564 start_codon:yes stop_codon:yes gene_type:complete